MDQTLHCRGLLLDMDGLLLDTERLAQRCWRAAEEETGKRLPDGYYFTLIGLSMRLSRQRLTAVFGNPEETEAFLRVVNGLYRQALESDCVPVKKGAADFLKWLQDNRVPVCLATSTGRDLASHKLEAAGLAPYLPLRVCGDEVARSKPDPEIYREAARRLGLPPEQLLAVEDSENGLRSALSAGCRVAHIPDLGHVSLCLQQQVDRVYRSLDDLREGFLRKELQVAAAG